MMPDPFTVEDELRDRLNAANERMLKHYACSCSLATLVDIIVNSRWEPKPTDSVVKQAKERLAELAEFEGDPFFDAFKRRNT